MNCIVHVTESLGGGVLNVLAKITANQIDRGYKVYLIYSRRPDTPSEFLLDSIFPQKMTRIELSMSRDINLINDIICVFDIFKLFKSINPDIIHAHSSKAGILVRLAALFTSAKVFYTPHGFSFFRSDISFVKKILFWSFEAIGSLLGGSIIACSISEMNAASMLPKWHKVILIENGVDDIACKIQNFNSIQRNRLIVVSVGRLTVQKAPNVFFELAHLFPSIDFVWVGDGDIKPNAASWPKNLTITGWLDKFEICKILVNSDIFFMLSKWEGMPLALLEAMLIGLPVIVSDIGGCREVVNHGVNGFICKSRSDILTNLSLLESSPDIIQKMGTSSRDLALARFTSDRMCDQLNNAYFIDI